MKEEKAVLTTKDIAFIGVMVATIEAAKFALSFLPNIELVTLLIILYTFFFGKKVLYVIFSFVLIEGCRYGFGVWWIMYLYAWPLLALVTYLFRKKESVWFFSILSGAFGLCFGALCSIPYFFIGGPVTAFSWWIAGIPYDIIHCISNFTLCLVLFKPLRAVLKKLEHQVPFD